MIETENDGIEGGGREEIFRRKRLLAVVQFCGACCFLYVLNKPLINAGLRPLALLLGSPWSRSLGASFGLSCWCTAQFVCACFHTIVALPSPGLCCPRKPRPIQCRLSMEHFLNAGGTRSYCHACTYVYLRTICINAHYPFTCLYTQTTHYRTLEGKSRHESDRENILGS